MGDTIYVDSMAGAVPTRAWVLTSEESVNLKPPEMTNLNLALGVGVATPIVI